MLSKNQSSLLFDRFVMHLSVCPNFFRVRYSPSILRPTLQHVPASGLKFDNIFAACLPHLCRICAFLLCCIFAACFVCILAARIFVESLAASLPHLCRIFGCIFCFTCPIFYCTRRSWPHLARVQKHRFVNIFIYHLQNIITDMTWCSTHPPTHPPTSHTHGVSSRPGCGVNDASPMRIHCCKSLTHLACVTGLSCTVSCIFCKCHPVIVNDVTSHSLLI